MSEKLDGRWKQVSCRAQSLLNSRKSGHQIGFKSPSSRPQDNGWVIVTWVLWPHPRFCPFSLVAGMPLPRILFSQAHGFARMYRSSQRGFGKQRQIPQPLASTLT